MTLSGQFISINHFFQSDTRKVAPALCHRQFNPIIRFALYEKSFPEQAGHVVPGQGAKAKQGNENGSYVRNGISHKSLATPALATPNIFLTMCKSWQRQEKKRTFIFMLWQTERRTTTIWALCQVLSVLLQCASVCMCVCVRVCTDFTCNLLLCFIACLIFIMIIIVGITQQMRRRRRKKTTLKLQNLISECIFLSFSLSFSFAFATCVIVAPRDLKDFECFV